ncbi:chromo shadow domain from Swi6 protein, partial [Calycina marina]
SWEKQVDSIEVSRRLHGRFAVNLTWESGHRTVHTPAEAYKNCPQRMIDFFESNMDFCENEIVVDT